MHVLSIVFGPGYRIEPLSFPYDHLGSGSNAESKSLGVEGAQDSALLPSTQQKLLWLVGAPHPAVRGKEIE